MKNIDKVKDLLASASTPEELALALAEGQKVLEIIWKSPSNKGKSYRTKRIVLDELEKAEAEYRTQLEAENTARALKLEAHAQVRKLLTEARRKKIPTKAIGYALGGVSTATVSKRIKTARRKTRKRRGSH